MVSFFGVEFDETVAENYLGMVVSHIYHRILLCRKFGF